jgi:hypothetical protein
MSAAEEEAREVTTAPDQALLHAISKAELDQHITTAHAFPRSIKTFKDECMELATLDMATADECIYALPRREWDKQNKKWVTKNIEGPSARFAEIVLYSWGNCRGGARVVNEERDFIVSQGIFHDLQKNTHITFEVRRRITNAEGKRYNSDMIGVTGNAASSIALRNAVLKGVPKALWNPAYEAARKVCVGDQKTLANYRGEVMQYLQKLGATPEMVFNTLSLKGLDDIGLDELAVLKGIANSIREGETTVERAFAPPEDESPSGKSRVDQIKDSLRANLGNGAHKAGDAAQSAAAMSPPVAGTDLAGKIPHFDEAAAIVELKKASSKTELELARSVVLKDYADTGRAVPMTVDGAYTDRFAYLEQQAQ